MNVDLDVEHGKVVEWPQHKLVGRLVKSRRGVRKQRNLVILQAHTQQHIIVTRIALSKRISSSLCQRRMDRRRRVISLCRQQLVLVPYLDHGESADGRGELPHLEPDEVERVLLCGRFFFQLDRLDGWPPHERMRFRLRNVALQRVAVQEAVVRGHEDAVLPGRSGC